MSTDKFSDLELLEKMGSRAVYGLKLNQLAKANKQILALSADLVKSSGLDRMSREMPNRVINTGIAEQNLIGVASGLASEGFIPFVSSFAPFITQRANEQIRMNLGYMEANVKLISLGSGLSMGYLGNSHFGTEDFAVIRCIPNINILSPADTTSLLQSLEIALNTNGPFYIRLTGIPNTKKVYSELPPYELGSPCLVRNGSDLIIFATGSMVRVGVEASIMLETKGVKAKVFDVHTLKPISLNTYSSILTGNLPIITIEEHSKIGGLGSLISEITEGFYMPRQILRIGLPDRYDITSDYVSLLNHHRLTPENVCNDILKFINKID
jgi:transketolase